MGMPKISTEEDLRIALDVYLTLWLEQGVKYNGKILYASTYFQRAATLIDNLRACQDKPCKAFKRSGIGYLYSPEGF